MYSDYQLARKALEQGSTTCKALVEHFLSVIEEKNDLLNAFISVDRVGALTQADRLDQEIQAGKMRPLSGMVMGIKDVICIKDLPVTCGSKMLEHFTSLYDATAIAKLREAGAIFIGKLNCDEFAMGSSNENSYFGVVKNPINTDYVPGGSSGGSAVAVAAGMCHTSLGTDTGGSIRQPAAFCGVMGIKPTYGRVSRMGLVAFASSFDSMGIFGHKAHDVASVLAIMAGEDPWDTTSSQEAVPDYPNQLPIALENLTFGLPKEYFAAGLDSEIKHAIETQVESLQKKGATIKEVSLPHTDYGIATYYILTTAEASSNLARYDGVRYGHRANRKAVEKALEAEDSSESLLTRWYAQTRTEGFGAEVKRRIMLGTYVLSAGYYDAYYAKAQKVRRLIQEDFTNAFESVDVILTPATPTTPFKIGSKTDDPLTMYLNDIYTVTANLAGIPGMVIPIATHSNQFPIGLQLLGKPFDEATLLAVANALIG